MFDAHNYSGLDEIKTQVNFKLHILFKKEKKQQKKTKKASKIATIIYTFVMCVPKN